MNILLHMPHVSLKVPKRFYKGLTINKHLFHKYNLEMADLGIDELFKGVDAIKISPRYSRLYCDVERFRNDEDEVMSQYGQGVVYTNVYDGALFHLYDEQYKEKVLKYYDKYHKKLDRLARKLLKKDEELLILDCHSFSDQMAAHFYEPPFPDVCIGIEEDYYDQEIVDKIVEEIQKLGYSYRINYPYRGSLVPNCVYTGKVKGRVVSIMLEINKRIYL